ncbi:MAG: alpha/beta hydrolase [Lachnospiraceae bacterium]|nr:alpha/beta hydrolase [Lachnospiraceae bacterium]
MKTFRVDLWKESEYTYEAAYGFMPNIRAFLHEEDDTVRRCMIVAPGGGYCMCAPHEGELVAMDFYKRGFNVFVITYTTDITMSIPLKKQPANDLARTIRLVRKNAEEYKISPDKLAICGFSAAGHLCATVATHYDDLPDIDPAYADISCRPDAVILGYPVITAGEYTHGSSIESLLGREPEKEELDYFSAEKNVTENTPPCFIWQTLKDSLVPVENSYLFANALRAKKVDYAQYVFPFGDHGLSVASPEQFFGWKGGEYSMEQLNKVLEHVKANTLIKVSERRRNELMEQFFGEKKAPEPPKSEDGDDRFKGFPKPGENPFADVSMWPELAYIWMSRII